MTRPGGMRWIASSGALLAGVAVALAAYASHAATPDARMRLFMAAAFAFGHGAVLAVGGAAPARRLAQGAWLALLVGTLLFAGSLVGAVLFGLSTRLAPLGGLTLIGGWLVLAIDRARR